MHPARVYRLPNRFTDVEAEHLKWIREAIANSCELLNSTRPNTFAGRKTQEPFALEPSPDVNSSYRSLES